MSTKSKTLAKSLHTVTVLVQVARLIQRLNNETAESALVSAMIELGYLDAADPYDLRGKALTQLKRGFDL